MGNGIRPPLETQRGYNNSLQYLVGGFNPSEKNMKSIGMMTFPTEWKHRKWSKPPTRYMFDI